MKKLFISQPMAGKTDEEILKTRENAIKSAERELGEPVEVIESFFQGTKKCPLWCLGESLKLMSEADVIYLADGWEKARGCRIEAECAFEYGLPFIEECIEEDSLYSFGEAVELMKLGMRVARKNWNGPGQCVAYQKGYPEGIPCNKNTAEAWGIKEGTPFKCRPYFQLKCVDGSFQMWVPSISDCLAEDWYIVDQLTAGATRQYIVQAFKTKNYMEYVEANHD